MARQRLDLLASLGTQRRTQIGPTDNSWKYRTVACPIHLRWLFAEVMMADDAERTMARRIAGISDRAIAHLLAVHSGGGSDAERYELLRWLKASPLHVGEYLRAARLYCCLLTQLRTEDQASPPADEASLEDLAPKERSLSLTYLRHVLKANYPAKIALTLCAGAMALFSLKSPDWEIVGLASAAAGYLALIILKERIVEYRIRRGFFGTTRSEARELIDFVVRSSVHVDFTGGSRKRQPALLVPASSDNTPSAAESMRGRATAR